MDHDPFVVHVSLGKGGVQLQVLRLLRRRNLLVHQPEGSVQGFAPFLLPRTRPASR